MKHIISFFAAVFVLAGAGFGIYVWHWEDRPHVLEIYCFALDKSGNSPGNLAVFIRTPDGHTVLIDGGKTASVVTALTSVMPFYRRSIGTIISTNPDDSHVTGLTNVAGRYRVGQVIEMQTDEPATSSAYIAFEKEIASEKIKDVKVSSGDGIDLGDPKLSVNVIFPVVATHFPFSKTNVPVLVFVIHYGATTILFGGDITKKEQEYLSQNISSSTNTLLILPHAENSGVADESFFTALNLQHVVVMKNPAGAPRTRRTTSTSTKQMKPAKAPFVITSIPNLSITNLVTDGDTEFISDGVRFTEKKI